jgi:hypothetical protein
MLQIINLETELLVDQSTIQDPYLRIMAIAIGQAIVRGSPWLAINKTVAKACSFPTQSAPTRFQHAVPDVHRVPAPRTASRSRRIA